MSLAIPSATKLFGAARKLARFAGVNQESIGFDDLSCGLVVVGRGQFETNGSWDVMTRVVRDQLASGASVVVLEDHGSYFVEHVERTVRPFGKAPTLFLADWGFDTNSGHSTSHLHLNRFGCDAETVAAGIRDAFPLLSRGDADLVEALAFLAATRIRKGATLLEAMEAVAAGPAALLDHPDPATRARACVVACRTAAGGSLPSAVCEVLREYRLRARTDRRPGDDLGRVVAEGGLLLCDVGDHRGVYCDGANGTAGETGDCVDAVRLLVSLAVEAARRADRRVVFVTCCHHSTGTLWRMASGDEGRAFVRRLRSEPHVGFATTAHDDHRPWGQGREDCFATRMFIGGSEAEILPPEDVLPGADDRAANSSWSQGRHAVVYRRSAASTRIAAVRA